MFPKKLSLVKWIAILPKLVELVTQVVDAFKDGRLDEEEIKRLGDDFVALIVAAISH